MQPPARRAPCPVQIERARLVRQERDFFFSNLNLLLDNEQTILSVDEYFFCQPSFARGGRPMCSSSLNLGTLLLGWRTQLFIDICQNALGQRQDRAICGGRAFVYFFAGPMSGTGWSGYCPNCKGGNFTWNNSRTNERADFVSAANQQFQNWSEGLEFDFYPSFKFSFGNPARVPSIEAKMRKVKRPLVNGVSTYELVDELKSGCVRPPTPSDKTLLREFLILKQGDLEPAKIKLLDTRGSTS